MRAPDAASVNAEQALQELRRATVLRSVRANARWVLRAVGWGSVVYLMFWTVILVIGAVQSVAPLSPAVADAVTAWSAPAGSAVLALAALLAARTTVTPLWLDRRDLTHLASGAAPPRAVLAWPALRLTLPAIAGALALAGVPALLVPRLLGEPALAALLVLPALAVGLRVLRWRAALTRARDPVAWAVAVGALVAAALSLGCTWLAAPACALTFSAPAAAALGSFDPWLAAAVGGALAIAVAALVVRTIATSTRTLPAVVLLQSELLAELRAIATLRGLDAVTGAAHDPGARFAAARARAALHARPSALKPRWRPPIPARGGAVAAFAWLGVVRAWRSSPWSLLAVPVVTLAAVAFIPPSGPFGSSALAPSLAFAWAAAQLYPGRAGWPGFAIDVRARTIATVASLGLLGLMATIAVDTTLAVLTLPAMPDAWLMVPLALAAAALLDLIGARAADPRGLDVWLLTAVVLASPAAILGWSGIEPGVAAPLSATAWITIVWLRILAAPRVA